jgi:uncharacterized membrane protein YjjP (DUF1212 family)
VPPQFARVLALSILHQVFNEDIPAKIEYMSQNHQLGFRARKSELTDCYLEKAKKAISKIKPTKKYSLPHAAASILILKATFALLQNLEKMSLSMLQHMR